MLLLGRGGAVLEFKAQKKVINYLRYFPVMNVTFYYVLLVCS